MVNSETADRPTFDSFLEAMMASARGAAFLAAPGGRVRRAARIGAVGLLVGLVAGCGDMNRYVEPLALEVGADSFGGAAVSKAETA